MKGNQYPEVGEPASKNRAMTNLALFIGLVLVAIQYFSLPCYRYLTDGLLAAINMRDSDGWYVHANHPLFPLLLQILHNMIGRISELEILVVWSIMMGILSCTSFVIIMRTLSMSTATTLTGLGLFAFTFGIWNFFVIPGPSSTAIASQIFTLVVFTYAIKSKRNNRNWVTFLNLGIFTALATLASQINAVLLLPAGYIIYTSYSGRQNRIFILLGFFVFTIVLSVVLLILIGIGFGGSRTMESLLYWQQSYPYKGRYWVNGLWEAIDKTWHGAVNVLIPNSYRDDGIFGIWSRDIDLSSLVKRIPLIIGQFIVLLFYPMESIRSVVFWFKTRKLLPIQWIGIGTALPLMCFLSIWTAGGIHYRIMYLPGLILFMLPSIERFYRLDRFSIKRAWPVILVILSLYSVSLYYHFVPLSDPMRTQYYEEVMVLEDDIGPGDIVILSGSGDSNMRMRYLQYFLNCTVVRANELIPVIRNHPEDVINGFAEMFNSGSSLFILKDALYSDEDVQWMNENLGTDIKPGELLEYMQPRMIPIMEITIRDEVYIKFIPFHPRAP